jgi:hypothetical protein
MEERMANWRNTGESSEMKGSASAHLLDRRALLGRGIALAGAFFRMNPMFETSSPKYDWMNRIIAVGTGHRLADGPLYSIFEVL